MKMIPLPEKRDAVVLSDGGEGTVIIGDDFPLVNNDDAGALWQVYVRVGEDEVIPDVIVSWGTDEKWHEV